jgi:hypothetical protein
VVFGVYCWRRKSTLKRRRDKFIKHFRRRLRSPTQVKTRDEHDSKRPEDQSMKLWNSEHLNKKCGSSHAKYPYPNRGKTSSRTHKKWHKFKEAREAMCRKAGPNQAENGLDWSAEPILGSIRAPLFPRCSSINCLCLRRPPYPSIHHHSAKPRSKHRRETTAAASLRSCLGDGLGLP